MGIVILFVRIRFATLLKFFQKRKDPRPLISHHQDVEILRQLKKRKVPHITQIRHVSRILTSFEKRTIRLCLFVCILGVAWLLGGWFMTHRSQMPAVGGKYVEGMVGSPQYINPIFASRSDVDSDLTKLMFTGLMRYDETGALVPDLAEKYELSEDKKTYTFHLRKNVSWHDSAQEPFTSKDIKFTFDLIQDKNVGSPLYVSFEGVAISAVDDFTVEFKLNEPFPLFLSSLTVGILPEHIWGSIPVNQLLLAKYNLQPVGTGPYQFNRLSKNETGYIDKYELVRFDRFYRDSAFIENFVFAFFPAFDSDAGAVEALRSQKIQGLGFVPSSLQDKVNKKSLALYNLSFPQYTALFFNLEKTDWRERVEVRNALAKALDRSKILKESLKDEGQLIEGPLLSHYHVGEAPEVTTYDVQEANTVLDKYFKRLDAAEYREKRREELLKEFKAGEEVVTSTESVAVATSTSDIEAELNQELGTSQTFYRLDSNKNILRVSLVTADTEEYHHTAQLVLQFWQEIGVKVDLTYVNPKSIEKEVLRERKYDVLLYGVILGDNPDPYPFWHSSQIKFPGVNLSQYTNKKVDTLIEKIRTSQKPEEVQTSYTEFQKLLVADRPAIFLYSPLYRYFVSDDVKGISLEEIYHPSDRFSGVTKWYIKTDSEFHWKK